MRILHITGYYAPAFEWGGPARSVAALAEAQVRAGAEVAVATTDARGNASLPRLTAGTFDINGVSVTYYEARGPRRYFFSPRFLLAQPNPADFDVVHVHGLWTFPVMAGALRAFVARRPYVLSPRGSLGTWARGHHGLRKTAYMAAVDRHCIRLAGLVHATSQPEADQMPAFARKHLTVIPNPVDLSQLVELPLAERPVGRELVLLILGRIHAVKGFDQLVPALAVLRARGVRVRLVVCGPDDGGHESTVRQAVRRAGVEERVVFLGEQNRQGVVDALRKSDAVVMPSYQENFGLAAAEAMASGRPLIASENVGIAQDAAKAGAAIVTKVSAESIANAVEALLSGDFVGQAARGRAFVLKTYSPDSVANRMLEAYQDILRGQALASLQS